jgi:photosystem II stability/assembly factor-like uncharacterized protein
VVNPLPHPIPGGGFSVSFIDAQTGWVAASGSLFVTRDGGQEWTWLADVAVKDLDFVSGQRGWGQGSEGLLNTSDGGLTWENYPLPSDWFSDTWRLYTFDFASPARAWVALSQEVTESAYSGQARNYRILRTADGGSSWEPVALPCAAEIGDAPVNWERIVIHLVGERDAWLVCGGSPYRLADPEDLEQPFGWLYRSTGDGAAWQPVIQLAGHELYRGNPYWINTVDPPSVFFVDEQFGWVGTGGTGLLVTSDGGDTWETILLPFFNNTAFDDVHVFSPLHGLAVWEGSFSAVLAETRDGGESWRPIFPPTLPRQVQFFDSLHGVGLGSFPWQNNQFLRTDDGGRTWELAGHVGRPSWVCLKPVSEERDCVFAVQSFDFIDPLTGWALAKDEPDGLYITRDGGLTWSPLPPLPAAGNNYALSFVDERTGFLIDYRGTLYATQDGGQSFAPVTQTGNNDPAYLQVCDFASPLEGVMTEKGPGYVKGRVYLTDDGGHTWSCILVADRMLDLGMFPGGALWVLDEALTLWFSPDRGQRWTRFDMGKVDSRFYPSSFDFVDEARGWLRTSDHLYATSDGGHTWEMVR